MRGGDVRVISGDGTLSGDALSDDPTRLSDELATIPMLGGFRLVRVKDAADSMFAAALTGQEAVEIRRWVLGPEGKSRGRRRGPPGAVYTSGQTAAPA